MNAAEIRVAAIAVLIGFALSPAIPAAAHAAGPQVPRLDVTPTCRPLEKNDMQLDEKRCRASENEAREQLVKQWSSYPAADRQECTIAATMGGTASYVELITCLDMKRNVAQMPSKDATIDKPAATRKKR